MFNLIIYHCTEGSVLEKKLVAAAIERGIEAEAEMELSEEQLFSLFGEGDENLDLLEKLLEVRITARSGQIRIFGAEDSCKVAVQVISQLAELAAQDTIISTAAINYAVALVKQQDEESEGGAPSFGLLAPTLYTTPKGKQIKAKTFGQRYYIDAVNTHDITFAIGPAGTGKTYLAVVMAVMAFKRRDINRIVLVRPAVEAGEKLGFLPGDLQEKVDPYLRPVYDALDDVLGTETAAKLLERGVIEVVPLAYMRGRTLDEAFIILDEAQNTTPMQMKMFLTRMGMGSKTVITGDVTQIDLPTGQVSGLVHARNILQKVPGIAFCYLTGLDIVRHPLVQKIIEAYDKASKKA